MKTEDKPLFLALRSEELEKVVSGEKVEEYRDFTMFYISRLTYEDADGNEFFRQFDKVLFRAGRNKSAKYALVELEDIEIRGEDGEEIFVLHLGKVIETDFSPKCNA